MKIQTALAMGLIVATLGVSGCATSKVGPATTTLGPMKNVGPVTLVERRTVVIDGKTNFTLVEITESPESAQARLRGKELEGNQKVAVAKAKGNATVEVAKANRPSVSYIPSYYGTGNYYPPSYGYSYGGGGYVTPYGNSGGYSGGGYVAPYTGGGHVQPYGHP